MIDYESKLLIVGTIIGIIIGWFVTSQVMITPRTSEPKEVKDEKS